MNRNLINYLIITFLLIGITSIFLLNHFTAPKLPESPTIHYIALESSESPITQLVDLNLLTEGRPLIISNPTEHSLNPTKLNDVPTVDFTFSPIIDFRSQDLTDLDFNKNNKYLEYAMFDTNTIWTDNKPEWFQADEILEWGMNPGLGIRALHNKGITGEGVNIAVIDSALLQDHIEYSGKIMTYEFINYYDEMTTMHGTSVLSILSGENVGIAPNANIYYIACAFGDIKNGIPELDLTYLAESIYRIIEINEKLNNNEKIRVISVSTSLEASAKGVDAAIEAIDKAKENNIFVITTMPEVNYNFYLRGLGKEYHADPDLVDSYKPSLLESNHLEWGTIENDGLTIRVPMEARTFASFTGKEDYTFAQPTGYSFAVPWLAGMYALCVQARPDITPELFINTITECSPDYKYQYMDKEYHLGIIIDPEKVIEKLF